MDTLANNKIIARKNIVKYEQQYKKSNSEQKIKLLIKIAKEKDILLCNIADNKFSELVHTARHDGDMNICSICTASAVEERQQEILVNEVPVKYSLGKLRELLESNAYNEWYNISPNPSQTDLERWALMAAVSDYYNLLQHDASASVCDNPESLRANRPFAPNKEKIYTIWMEKLKTLSERKDKYTLDTKKLESNIDKGIPRGGAFEKQLDRYRENFMSQFITSNK